MNQLNILLRASVAMAACICAYTSAGQACFDEGACNYDPLGSPYCLEVDTVLVHTEGALAGMTTYRLYFISAHPEDFVSAVFGDAEYPLSIATTTSFYQDALGATTPNNIFTALYPQFPQLEYDSWVTIGIEAIPNALTGEADVQYVSSFENAWNASFDAGESIEIADTVGGAWFVLNGDANGFPDTTGRVLLGQFTTDGMLSGQLNLQVFPEGLFGDEGYDLVSLGIGAPCGCIYPTTYYVDEDGDGYGTTPVELCGPEEGYAPVGGDCNDGTAIAYPGNPMDLIGDGIDGNCDGGESCFRDVDNDGYRSADASDFIGSPFNINCSEFGEAYAYQPIDCNDEDPELTIADEDGNCITNVTSADEGCGNPLACNFDPEVPSEDNNCEYLSCRGCPNPGACNYDPEAQILTEEVCDFITCAGCTDVMATNYNAEAVISNDSDCIYSGVLSIGPISVNFNSDGGPTGTYTNEVYALLPPNAIRLKQVLGVKGGDVRLRIEPFSSVYQSESCNFWTPLYMQATETFNGVEYSNPDCLADSWFTIGGSIGEGPVLEPLGMDTLTYDSEPDFDSELLAAEGDTLGWEIVGEEGGVPANHCLELGNRPGCANSVRIARITMPLGESFFFQAGLTYTVLDEGGRSLTGFDFTDDSSVTSGSGGGGESDDDNSITDGVAAPINGCLDPYACNYDASANTDSGNCDYDSCTGCTYPEADNYDDTFTIDDGTCTFSTENACPLDLDSNGLIGSSDLLLFLTAFDTDCP